MSETFTLIQRLVASGEVRVFERGYDERAEDGISVSEILVGVGSGTVVLVTAYRPDPTRWDERFMERRK